MRRGPSITLTELLARAAEAGVFLSCTDGKLHFKLSAGSFPEALRNEITAHKTALLEFLQQRQSENAAARPPLLRRSVECASDFVLLSFAQQRLWFIDRVGGGSAQYNMPGALRVHGRFDVEVAERSLRRIVERHETLRTVFIEGPEGPLQHVRKEFDFHLERLDLSGLETAEQERAVKAAMGSDALRPFDLSSDLMLRASYLQLGEAEGVLLFNLHHIASDGWSMGILVEEFGKLYEALAEGKEEPLQELAIQYADYAEWQRGWLKGELVEEQLSYWEKQLAELPEVHGVPLDHARPAVQTYRGRMHREEVARETVRGLKEVAAKGQATLYMVLQGVFALLLSRYGNTADVVMGTPVANRGQKELEPLVGFFVNTLVLRTDCGSGRTFREYLDEVKRVNLEAQSHQDVPFEQVVERVRPRRSASHEALFQILFAMNTQEAKEINLDGLSLKPLSSDSAPAKFDLTLEVVERGGALELIWAYNNDLFESGTIARMAEHYQNLLRGVVKNADERIERLPLLSEAEQRHWLYEVNRTEVEYPRKGCVHELIEEQVERNEDRVAVVYEGESLSYGELNRKANQVAHYLREQGVKPDTLVGLCVERSLEMVVGIVGVLKAGGAYVPLEPGYPAERLEYMVSDSAPAVVLTQGGVEERLGKITVPVLRLDRDGEELQRYSTENVKKEEVGLRAEHLAYVIYTSGSTGRPKGVMNEHGGVVNGLLWARDAYQVGSTDRILQKTPYSFDVSVWDLLLPLIAGARVVMARPGGHLEPEYLGEVLEREKITLVHFVPSMLQVFLEYGGARERWGSLKRVLCSGEALPYALQVEFQRKMPGVELHNLYGPTEAAIDVTAWHCRKGEHAGVVPIGRPIANTQIYLLDAQMQPVPQGVTGELWIGGVGVGRGYWKREELTAERFVKDPFRSDVNARMYRTGDLARWLPDGAIEYLGRNDQQVKVRGFRIELGEIEQALLKLPGVTAAAVTAQEQGAGEKRLVAYVVAGAELRNEADEAQLEAAARKQLQSQLPEYMVPSAFVLLERLPLTPNGKLDRKALPAAEAGFGRQEYVAPATETESALVQIWAEVLKLEASQVSVTANFFELGGNSLLGIHLHAMANKTFGNVLELRDIFILRSVQELAAFIDTHQSLRESKPAARSNLWQLKPAGEESSRPLFLVHPVSGYALCYNELAGHIDHPCAIFGLQVDGVSFPESMDAMAGQYIQAMKRVQPEGPYLVGGWSMGGVVAYEIAQQLKQAQERVDLLLMLDSFCPGSRHVSGEMREEDERAPLVAVAAGLGIEKDLLDKMPLEDLLETVLRLGHEQKHLPSSFGMQELRERYTARVANAKAMRAYRPSPFDGEIQLVRAQENNDPDWFLGWGALAAKVAVTEQSGGHSSMIYERPHVLGLARTISEALQRLSKPEPLAARVQARAG